MDLLQAITHELLSRNNISDETAQTLSTIKVQQHHSRKVAEMLLYYPSLKDELVEMARKAKIESVVVTVQAATGKTKPFWDFSQYTVATLVINER
jgi:hypothetical protein